MLNYYKTIDNKICQIDKLEEGCWVNVVSPTEEEIQYFRKIFQEIRLFPIGNISDIDEEWRKINEGQNCYHY